MRKIRLNSIVSQGWLCTHVLVTSALSEFFWFHCLSAQSSAILRIEIISAFCYSAMIQKTAFLNGSGGENIKVCPQVAVFSSNLGHFLKLPKNLVLRHTLTLKLNYFVYINTATNKIPFFNLVTCLRGRCCMNEFTGVPSQWAGGAEANLGHLNSVCSDVLITLMPLTTFYGSFIWCVGSYPRPISRI